jgi:hypothetical protein
MEEKIKKLNLERLNQPQSHYGSSTKETFKACGKLVRAACSSYICFVAIFIPIFPAEKKAPKTKATTINICVVGTK